MMLSICCVCVASSASKAASCSCRHFAASQLLRTWRLWLVAPLLVRSAASPVDALACLSGDCGPMSSWLTCTLARDCEHARRVPPLGANPGGRSTRGAHVRVRIHMCARLRRSCRAASQMPCARCSGDAPVRRTFTGNAALFAPAMCGSVYSCAPPCASGSVSLACSGARAGAASAAPASSYAGSSAIVSMVCSVPTCTRCAGLAPAVRAGGGVASTGAEPSTQDSPRSTDSGMLARPSSSSPAVLNSSSGHDRLFLPVLLLLAHYVWETTSEHA